jgi:hypothetical protein
MNKLASWTFYSVLIAYALYNALWMIGITFSWGRNDTNDELIYLFLTFIVDIPIMWYSAKHLKIGLCLFTCVLICSFLFVKSWGGLSITTLSMWYAPKVFVVASALWYNISSHRHRDIRREITSAKPPD